MKMDEHARAWSHEFVADLLRHSAVAPEQRNSLHWEILNHVHEAAESRVEARGGTYIALADVQATVSDLGGAERLAAAFLQTRLAATPRAGFGPRAGAFLVDIVLGLFAGGFLMIPFWFLGPFPGFLLFYGYLVVMEYRFGATVGKMAFKLKVSMVDGRPVTLEAALIRNVAKALPPLLLADVILYFVSFHQDDQRASDRIADTIVLNPARTNFGAPPPAMPPAATSPTPPSGIPFVPPAETSAPEFRTQPPKEG